jgi:ABC-type uncharacterized transport system involved in gliding motility auxiliary subunit
MERKALATDTLVFLTAVAINVVLLNVIGTKVSARADLTRDDIFTLSPGSVRILQSLEDDLTVKVYVTKDLPAPFNRLPRFVEDKLEEYKASSGGRMRYQILYPEDDEKLRKEAQEQGIVQGNVQAIKSDKLDVRKVYMGLVMYYGNQKEVIPWLPEGHRRMEPIYEYMEYNLSARVKKLSRGGSKKRRIGFLGGHEEPPPAQALKRVSETLKEVDYEVTVVDTSGDKTIPADIDLLVIAGPKKKLTDREKWEVDQHLMRGRPVAFFLDAVNLQPQRGMLLGSPNDDNLKDLVAHYGVKMQAALTLDERCIPVPVPAHQRIGNLVIQGNVFKPYPPILAINGFAQHPLMRGVAAKKFILPFSAPLELVPDKIADKEVTELAWSSPDAWKMDGSFFLLNPTQDFSPPWRKEMDEALIKAEKTGDESGLPEAEKKMAKAKEEKGPPKQPDGRRAFPLAYAVHGKFKSFFAGKPLPAGVKGGAATVNESPATQILVIGDAFFLQDNFFAPGNQLFLQNAVDWLLQDEDLMQIRARTFASPPLNEVGLAKEVVRYANVLGVPLALVAYGIVRWFLRRRRKANVTV